MTSPLRASPTCRQARSNAARWRCGKRRRGAEHGVGVRRRCLLQAFGLFCAGGASCLSHRGTAAGGQCKNSTLTGVSASRQAIPKPASNPVTMSSWVPTYYFLPPSATQQDPSSAPPWPLLSVTSSVTLGLRDNHHDVSDLLRCPQSQVSFQSQSLPHLGLGPSSSSQPPLTSDLRPLLYHRNLPGCP